VLLVPLTFEFVEEEGGLRDDKTRGKGVASAEFSLASLVHPSTARYELEHHGIGRHGYSLPPLPANQETTLLPYV